ncbi:MAG TPA: DUF2510 domain-containing protein [Acidimicrobiales bacterium]|nr:DUF2510 domain-containing protein [Acidimicrobiales bacterium]
MSLTPAPAVPPGWYPDPSGARQWRVWTGTRWSEVTRPYGERSAPVSAVASLPLIQALDRVSRYGVVGVLGGLGLYVSVLSHWPGSANPVPTWFASLATTLALSFFFLGSAAYAFAARELRGHWSLSALVPLVNLEVVNAQLTQRLGSSPTRRVVADSVLLVLFVMQFHHDVWLGVAPVLVALSQSFWVRAFLEQNLGTTKTSSRAT